MQPVPIDLAQLLPFVVYYEPPPPYFAFSGLLWTCSAYRAPYNDSHGADDWSDQPLWPSPSIFRGILLQGSLIHSRRISQHGNR